jgi:hypothetical protein
LFFSRGIWCCNIKHANFPKEGEIKGKKQGEKKDGPLVGSACPSSQAGPPSWSGMCRESSPHLLSRQVAFTACTCCASIEANSLCYFLSWGGGGGGWAGGCKFWTFPTKLLSLLSKNVSLGPQNQSQKSPLKFSSCANQLYLRQNFIYMINKLIWNGIYGCEDKQRSQCNYFTKGLCLLFSFFSFFLIKDFLNEFFCNLLLKIHIVVPIYHMFCVNHCWININFFKCVNFIRFCVSFWKFIIILNHTKIC